MYFVENSECVLQLRDHTSLISHHPVYQVFTQQCLILVTSISSVAPSLVIALAFDPFKGIQINLTKILGVPNIFVSLITTTSSLQTNSESL